MADAIAKIAARQDVNPKEGEHKYGDVTFADEKNKKYPIDTEEHVRAALRYIGMPKNRAKYSAGDLAVIEGRIHAAARKFGIDTEKSHTEFTFFADLVKAYEKEGEMFIEGEASGTEVDQDGERMAVSAIKSQKRSVDEGLVREDGTLTAIPLVDAHSQDGVLRELGDVDDASINEKNHLAIKAHLDKDNPAAVSLYKQLQKGKQFGLSVAGYVNKADKVFDETLGKYIKTFLDITLTEISVTTRPSWAESWVAAVAKSYITTKAMDDTNTPLETTEEVVAQETGLETEVAEKPVEEIQEAPAEATQSEEEVQKAGKTISEATKAKLMDIHDHVAKAHEHMQMAKDSLGSLMIGEPDGDEGTDGYAIGMDDGAAKSHIKDDPEELTKLQKAIDEMKKTYEEKIDSLSKEISYLKKMPLNPKGTAFVNSGRLEKTEDESDEEQKALKDEKVSFSDWYKKYRA